MTSYGAINYGRQKKPQLKQCFGVFASDRASVSTEIFLIIIINIILIKLFVSTTLVTDK